MSKDLDWEAVEREYRAGQLSVREIAGRNGISEGAIRKKAKQNGWQRDLSGQVRQRVRTESVRSEVRSTHTEDDEEVVEKFAQRGAEIENMQRGQVSQLLSVGETLLQEVQNSDLELNKRTSCFRDLSQAAARLIPMQRQMYRLDDEGGGESYEDQLRRLADE